MYRKLLQQIRQMENVSATPYDQVKVELGQASYRSHGPTLHASVL